VAGLPGHCYLARPVRQSLTHEAGAHAVGSVPPRVQPDRFHGLLDDLGDAIPVQMLPCCAPAHNATEQGSRPVAAQLQPMTQNAHRASRFPFAERYRDQSAVSLAVLLFVADCHDVAVPSKFDIFDAQGCERRTPQRGCIAKNHQGAIAGGDRPLVADRANDRAEVARLDSGLLVRELAENPPGAAQQLFKFSSVRTHQPGGDMVTVDGETMPFRGGDLPSPAQQVRHVKLDRLLGRRQGNQATGGRPGAKDAHICGIGADCPRGEARILVSLALGLKRGQIWWIETHVGVSGGRHIQLVSTSRNGKSYRPLTGVLGRIRYRIGDYATLAATADTTPRVRAIARPPPNTAFSGASFDLHPIPQRKRVDRTAPSGIGALGIGLLKYCAIGTPSVSIPFASLLKICSLARSTAPEKGFAMGSQSITEPKNGNAAHNGDGRLVCRECGKVFTEKKKENQANPDWFRTAEGPLCRNRPECRGRQLHAEFEKRGLKRWARHTQEQLLAVMDVPPTDWDRSKKWESVYAPHERLRAAVEFYSTCWPVCLLYAVQTDAEGEPVREFGEWKRHTNRSLAAVLALSQATVQRAVTHLARRNLLTVLDDRLYAELAPKLLTLQERDSIHESDSYGINNLAGLLPKALKTLAKTRERVSPESYTRVNAVAIDARTRQNRAISDARTLAADTVINSCHAELSLLSRLEEGETSEVVASSSSSFGNPPGSLAFQDGDDDGTVDMYLHVVESLRPETDGPQLGAPEAAIPPAGAPGVAMPDPPSQTPEAISEMYAAGFGIGALAKLPSPRPAVDLTPVQKIAEGTGLDEDAAGKIWRKTRALDASVTGPEVQRLVIMKLGQLREAIRRGKVENLPGLLIEAVPKMVKGPDLRAARDFLHAAGGDAAGAEQEEESNIRFAGQILSGAVEDAGPAEIDWAREISDAAKRKGMK
jgi:hypothetical protein